MFLLLLILPGSMGSRKHNGKGNKRRKLCAQITARSLLQVSEAAFLLFSSAFLMFPVFILYPKVYYLFLISFPSLFFQLSMLNCKRTQIFFTRWLLKITSVKHRNVKWRFVVLLLNLWIYWDCIERSKRNKSIKSK